MLVEGAPVIVIAVMGVTGSGKSNFVRLATGDDRVRVGHTLTSCTDKITTYPFSACGYNFILVDTPGFDDTHKSDREVLSELANWLEFTYQEGFMLHGIIYLHRIMDNRMSGSGMRNLKMFRKLCGDDPLKNVVLATTFWGCVGKDVEEAREKELVEDEDFWADMVAKGSEVTRFDGTQAGALNILMKFAQKRTIKLKIQEELVDENMELKDTEAGVAVSDGLAELKRKYEEDIKNLKSEWQDAFNKHDEEMKEVAEKQQKRVEKKLARVQEDQDLLRAERRREIRQRDQEWEMRLRRVQLEHDQVRSSDLQKFDERVRRERAEAEQVRKQGLEAQTRMTNEQQPQRKKSRGKSGQVAVKLLAAVGHGTMAMVNPFSIPNAIISFIDLLNTMGGS